MKKINLLFSSLLVLFVWACTSDDFNSDFLTNAEAPSEISALFTIKQDNSGDVTIRPNGSGVTQYKVFVNENATEPIIVNPGRDIIHRYTEGTFNVRIVGMGINGLESEVILPLTVSFLPPQNLTVTANPSIGNPYQVEVSAEADFATFFEVTFGEDPNQDPVMFNPGSTVSHLYQNTGEYTITVTAFSGGAATSTETVTFTVFDPIMLPITFESSTLNYAFVGFGGALGTVINNPNVNADNTSAKVGRFQKTAGSETWAGVFMTLDQPINFDTQNKISMKVWSPAVNTLVKFKVENVNNSNIFVEVDQATTIANGWETLTFDLGGIQTSNEYRNIVIFFNFGTSGTGESYYFDDLMLTDGTPQILLPLNFENTNFNYQFTDFGGCFAEVIDNPNPTGINTSARVGSLFKNTGSQVWAGAFTDLDLPIDFSTLQKIKMKVWSPQAGIQVLMKLENLANANIFVEVPATTTVANQWEELTFDFTGVVNTNNYQRIVLFFAFGNPGTGVNYYFDDIILSN